MDFINQILQELSDEAVKIHWWLSFRLCETNTRGATILPGQYGEICSHHQTLLKHVTWFCSAGLSEERIDRGPPH